MPAARSTSIWRSPYISNQSNLFGSKAVRYFSLTISAGQSAPRSLYLNWLSTRNCGSVISSMKHTYSAIPTQNGPVAASPGICAC